MNADAPRVFFPLLERKGGYPRKADGSYYGYAHYRSHVAADCRERCVYCDATEAEVEVMQLDHFRPESFEEFQDLVNDPLNLHYACARCNRWKSDNWPARGTAHTHNGKNGFIDPFKKDEDRLKYFDVKPDGQIEPVQPPADYMIRLLHLKREFLRKLREKRLLLVELRLQRITLKAALQADLDAGRLSDPKIILEFIERSERFDALLG
jgi:hypothetical protein